MLAVILLAFHILVTVSSSSMHLGFCILYLAAMLGLSVID